MLGAERGLGRAVMSVLKIVAIRNENEKGKAGMVARLRGNRSRNRRHSYPDAGFSSLSSGRHALGWNKFRLVTYMYPRQLPMSILMTRGEMTDSWNGQDKASGKGGM